MNKDEFNATLKNNPFINLSDLIYTSLREDIITMKLLPKAHINTAKLAQELEISRSPIQAAVRRLITEQLVVKEEKKFPSVSSVSKSDCMNLAKARSSLEGTAGYLTAKKINIETMQKLKDLASKYEQSVNSENFKDFENYDNDFHYTIIVSSENPYILEMYTIIQARLMRYRYFLHHSINKRIMKEILRDSIKSHWTICHLLENGIARGAKDELSNHSDSMRDILAII